jgi:hypothetical protein
VNALRSVHRWAPRIAACIAGLGALSVLAATRVVADNCDLTINPLDCQNTAWVIGGAAGIGAAAAGAAASGWWNRPKFPPIDNAQVQRYIDDALKKAGGDVRKAFDDLTSRRESNCYDTSLAAAEHYMFARYMVHDIWVPPLVAAAAVVGYDLYKFGSLFVIHFGNCPVAPASPGMVGWGLDGVLDGVK